MDVDFMWRRRCDSYMWQFEDVWSITTTEVGIIFKE